MIVTGDENGDLSIYVYDGQNYTWHSTTNFATDIRSIKIANNSNLIVFLTWNPQNKIYVLEKTSTYVYAEAQSFSQVPQAMIDMDMTSDHQFLAYGTVWPGILVIYQHDGSQFQHLQTISGVATHNIHFVEITDDHEVIAMGSADGYVYVFEYDGSLFNHAHSIAEPSGDPIRGLAITENHKNIYIGG